jgi:hypothetical protein
MMSREKALLLGQLHQGCFIDSDGVDVHALPCLAFATLLFEL